MTYARPPEWTRTATIQLKVAVLTARTRGGLTDEEIREEVELVISMLDDKGWRESQGWR